MRAVIITMQYLLALTGTVFPVMPQLEEHQEEGLWEK
jgi:hypothetical protein